MEKVDADGNVLGFSVLKVSDLKEDPLDVTLVSTERPDAGVEDDELDRIDRAFAEGTPIDAALIEAVREARQRHKEAGNPVAEWRDGKLCWVAPQGIDLDDEK